mmetsp:Transcript_38148/g.118624  ORF Transcript_38148/g.118624 Transcript_38148/m.118624 type:complete len:233 (-) Transcript_38148:383-1081(-)
MESYRLLLSSRLPPPTMRGFAGASASPRSAGVRSSTEAEMTSHRTSTPDKRPRKIGVAAVRANMMGARVASWSYKYLDSVTSLAWKVTCRQQQPMPYAMQSISMTGAVPLALRPPSAEVLCLFAAGSSTAPFGTLVASSTNSGMRMSTLAPRRQRMFCVRVPKRGCGLMHVSGTDEDSDAGPPGGAGGWTKSPTPKSGKFTTVGAISSGANAARIRARRRRMFCSTCTKLDV